MKRLFSTVLALMLCFSMGFSAFVPVRAESVHSECEHITPPKVSEENWGMVMTVHTIG